MEQFTLFKYLPIGDPTNAGQLVAQAGMVAGALGARECFPDTPLVFPGAATACDAAQDLIVYISLSH